MNFLPPTCGVWTWGGAFGQWQWAPGWPARWTPGWPAREPLDWRTPQWVTPGTDSSSLHGRSATDEDPTALPRPDPHAHFVHSTAHQTIQERYDAFRERGRRRADTRTRLQREPQKVKIEEMQSTDNSRSSSGGSSPPRLKTVTRASRRIRRDEKGAKTS